MKYCATVPGCGRNLRFAHRERVHRRCGRASPLDHSTPRVSRLPAPAERPRHVCNRSNEALYRSLIERVPGIVYISQFAGMPLALRTSNQGVPWLCGRRVAGQSVAVAATRTSGRSRLVLAEEQTPAKSGTACLCGIRMGRETAGSLVPR